MKHLALFIVLLFVGVLPVFGQDATAETQPDPTNQAVEVISGEGGDTIVNVGGETPPETPETPPEAPVEQMPWLASAILRVGEWGVQLLLAYIVIVRGVLAAVKAWLANPVRVKATEDSVELMKAFIPDLIERGIAAGLKQAENTTLELYNELRRGLVEATDGLPAAGKARPITETTSGGYVQTQPPPAAPLP